MISNYSWFNRSRIANVSLNSIPIKWEKNCLKIWLHHKWHPLQNMPKSWTRTALLLLPSAGRLRRKRLWVSLPDQLIWRPGDGNTQKVHTSESNLWLTINSFDDKIRIKMLFQNPLQMCVFATRIFRVRISWFNVVCISSWDCQSFLPKAAPKLTTMSRDLKLNKKGCQTLQNFLLTHAYTVIWKF